MITEPLQIRFLGGAGTVTGSKYLLSFNGKKILIDCGLFQGLKELRLKNWDRFPIDPKSVDAIVLTHAHLDHSGYIPRLVKEGFEGVVYCTEGTYSLSQIILMDTGFLQEEEAHYLGKHRLSKHAQPKALFNQSDVVSALQSFTPQKFMRWIEILPGLEIQFLPAGHILGAAMVLIKCRGQKLLFSGDVGRPHDPLFEPPSNLPADIDVLFLESTYGKHLHPCTDPLDDLSEILKQASANQSVVLIPAFTVGRAQTLLYYLMLLKRRGKVPWMPMYLNSPMALTATKVFCESKDHKLNAVERQEMLDTVRFVETAEESQKLNQRKGPMLIISASGMLTGGRILHHLKSFAGAANNLILLTGYQAEGTRGRALFDGLREIKVHQQLIAVRAEVRLLENLSAHADRNEILAWLEKTPELKPKKVFIVHGEPEASQALKQALDSRFGWDCTVPKLDQQFLLEF